VHCQGSCGCCCKEVPDMRAAAVEPSGGEKPQRDAKYVCEQIHHVIAEKIRGAHGLKGAQFRHTCFAEVVHDGEQFVGQFCNVFHDPKEEEGGKYAASEEDCLVAVEAW